MAIISSVKPVSVGKIFGVMYALLGFLGGAIMSLISLVGSVAEGPTGFMFPMFFCIGAVFILPIFYGGMGFVFGAVSGWLYNVVAKKVGGIELEIKK